MCVGRQTDRWLFFGKELSGSFCLILIRLNCCTASKDSSVVLYLSADHSIIFVMRCHVTVMCFWMNLRLFLFKSRYVSQWSWSHGFDPAQLPVPSRCKPCDSGVEHGEFAEGRYE